MLNARLHDVQTGLFRQDASGFTRVFVAADAESGGYGSGKCSDFSLHHFDTRTALISAQCPKQGTTTVNSPSQPRG